MAMNLRERGIRKAGLAVFLAAIAVLAVATRVPALVAAPPAAGAVSTAPAAIFAPRGLAADLLGARGSVRVRLLLKDQPVLAAALDRERRLVLSGRVAGAGKTPGTTHPLPCGASPTEERFARRQDSTRTRTLHELGAAGLRAGAQQAALLDAIRAAGGTVLGTSPAPSSVLALLPAGALSELAARPEVQAIDADPPPRPQLNISVPAVGAPAWWDAGHNGGCGTSDTVAADVGVMDNGIVEDHPAFAGVEFENSPPSDTGCGVSPLHGTGVAGTIVSRDATYRGVAGGADKVLNICNFGIFGEYSREAWAVGVAQTGVDLKSYPGAVDPAEVINFSSCGWSLPGQDDDARSQRADFIADTFGITYVASAGNEGPGTVCVPGTAYNPISVGAIDMMSKGDDRTDDVVASYSSGGPTVGGRKKPDLVAPGGALPAGRPLMVPNGGWRQDGQKFRGWEGTSFAAPHVAGAALLLAGSGVGDPIARKAILINSAWLFADQDARPPDQWVWAPDKGWGSLDLARALVERGDYVSQSVPAQGKRFYAASVNDKDRATLVWNRRALFAAYPDTTGSTALTLTNLDLYAYDGATGAQQSASASPIDSVEQVRSPAAGKVVYKVANASTTVEGAAAEPFALAGAAPLEPLAPPRLELAVDQSATSAAQGQNVTLRASVKSAGELAAHGARVTLAAPAGIEIVSGDASQPIGDNALEPGETATVTWTVRGTAGGSHVLPLTASAGGWGESFQAKDSLTLQVDSTPPSESGAPPPGVERRSSGLRLVRTRVRGLRVELEGRMARGATGTVRLAKAQRSSLAAGSSKRAQRKGHGARSLDVLSKDGRWRLGLRLARPGRYRLAIRYSGDERFRPAAIVKQVRVR